MIQQARIARLTAAAVLAVGVGVGGLSESARGQPVGNAAIEWNTIASTAIISTAGQPPHAARSPGAHLSAPTGNAVIAWNDTAATAALASCLAPVNNPLHESRMYTMMHLAIHDALNAIERRSRPYALDIDLPGASPRAAVAAAARGTLVPLLEELPPPFSDCVANSDAVADVEATYATALGAVPDGPAKTRGVALGQASAAVILAVRTEDGSDTPLFDPNYPQGTQPGEYRFTPGQTFAFAPDWGDVTPFALKDSLQFNPGPPYAVTSKKYAKDFNEVKRLGGDGVTTPSARTPDQTQIARFWVESSPLMWNRIARSVAIEKGLNLWESARLFGLLNMALTDGYIGTFATKYQVYNYWRPVTAIRLAATDGNPRTTADPTWTELVPTPPIPDYDSGHSVEGGAAAQVLMRFFRTDQVRFATCSFTLLPGETCTDPSPVLRSYNSFSAASQENGLSRILVGFHFRKATTEGINHGAKIGNRTVNAFLRPVH
jgi:hypothetical protein